MMLEEFEHPKMQKEVCTRMVAWQGPPSYRIHIHIGLGNLAPLAPLFDGNKLRH
jgi:hypothetical protein